MLKPMKMAAIVLFLLVASAVGWWWASTGGSLDTCQEAAARIDDNIQNARACSSDADCITVTQGTQPLYCSPLTVNRSFDEAKHLQMFQAYRDRGCGGKKTKCGGPTKRAACSQGECVSGWLKRQRTKRQGEAFRKAVE